MQQRLIDEEAASFFVIDAYEVAKETGMGARINTVMQTCFFAISGVLPREEAIAPIKKSIVKTYGKRGEAWCRRTSPRWIARSRHLHEVKMPGDGDQHDRHARRRCRPARPEFVRNMLGPMIAGHGDDLPVSAMPVDGTFPTGTAQWEKRNIALEIPVWDEELCIQCGKCVLVCPHAVDPRQDLRRREA